jgi:hypothetical protein
MTESACGVKKKYFDKAKMYVEGIVRRLWYMNNFLALIQLAIKINRINCT